MCLDYYLAMGKKVECEKSHFVDSLRVDLAGWLDGWIPIMENILFLLPLENEAAFYGLGKQLLENIRKSNNTATKGRRDERV